LCGYEEVDIVTDEDSGDPFTSPDELTGKLDKNTALLLVQYPDFFGRIYDYTNLIKKAHEVGALVAVVVNPPP